ncbi:MAG TPA: hypothetical protein VF172_13130 [Nitrososphaera sp.]|jgi:hypothetical protein
MAADPSAPQRNSKAHSRVHYWFQRNAHRLLAADIACVTILFFMYLFTSTFQVLTREVSIAVQLAAIVPAAFISLSVVWRGAVPLIVCVLGIVLMHNAVVLPDYEPETVEVTIDGRLYTRTLYTPTSVDVGSSMNFLLGLGMVAFSIIIAYRPAVLFTRNRPQSLESEWSRYPVWQDNSLLAGGMLEPSVSVKSLLTEQDRYLLWRYEYVLANIHGTPHLVSPSGRVPVGSVILKDRESGMVLGKARYNSFFV